MENIYIILALLTALLIMSKKVKQIFKELLIEEE